MTQDVIAWLENPQENFGWILIGDETQHSAKRFDSRESANASLRPQLSISFSRVPEPGSVALILCGGVFLIVQRRRIAARG